MKKLDDQKQGTIASLLPIPTKLLKPSGPEQRAPLMAPPGPTCNTVDEGVVLEVEETQGLQYWADRINRKLLNTVKAIVEAGKDLLQAKAELNTHGEWLRLFDQKLIRIGKREAQRLMQIARNSAISNATNWSHLPCTVQALCALSTVDVQVVSEAIHAGTITPQTTIKEAWAFSPKHSRERNVRAKKAVSRRPSSPQGRFLYDVTLANRLLERLRWTINSYPTLPHEPRTKAQLQKLEPNIDVLFRVIRNVCGGLDREPGTKVGGKPGTPKISASQGTQAQVVQPSKPNDLKARPQGNPGLRQRLLTRVREV